MLIYVDRTVLFLMQFRPRWSAEKWPLVNHIQLLNELIYLQNLLRFSHKLRSCLLQTEST